MEEVAHCTRRGYARPPETYGISTRSRWSTGGYCIQLQAHPDTAGYSSAKSTEFLGSPLQECIRRGDWCPQVLSELFRSEFRRRERKDARLLCALRTQIRQRLLERRSDGLRRWRRAIVCGFYHV